MGLEDFRKKEKGVYVRERRSVFSFNCSNVSAWFLSAIGAIATATLGYLFVVAINRADEVLRDAERINEWQKAQIELNNKQDARIDKLEDWRFTAVEPRLWAQGCNKQRCDNLEDEIDNLKERLR